MFDEMNGKKAIVTGATSGIGRESALLLAKYGTQVVLAGRREKEGLELQNEINASGGKALFVQTDVSEYKSVKNLIDVAQKTFGTIDYALNNAGIEGALGRLVDMSEEAFDEVFNTNLKSLWMCLKFELETMSSGGGAIVNISTNLTRMGMPGTGLYTASKAGVESLTKVAAIEHGKDGIRVNAICPGAVDTPMIRRVHPSKEALQGLADQNPMGRIAYPKEIANAVLWLLSPMSTHVNGEVMVIDGGGSLAS